MLARQAGPTVLAGHSYGGSGCSRSGWGPTTVEVGASHVAMVSHPQDVVALIEQAVSGVAVPA